MLGSTAQNVYLYVVNNENQGTGWVQTGSWAVVNHAPNWQYPEHLASATATPQTFTFVARDPLGYTDISQVLFFSSIPPLPHLRTPAKASIIEPQCNISIQ